MLWGLRPRPTSSHFICFMAMWPKWDPNAPPSGGLALSLPHYQRELVCHRLSETLQYQKLTQSNPIDIHRLSARSSPKFSNGFDLSILFPFVLGVLECSTVLPLPEPSWNRTFSARLSSQTLHPSIRWTAASQRPAMMAAPTSGHAFTGRGPCGQDMDLASVFVICSFFFLYDRRNE